MLTRCRSALENLQNESLRSLARKWLNFTWIDNFFIKPTVSMSAGQGATSHYGIVLNCTPVTKRVGYCPVGRDHSYRCQSVGRNSIYIGLTMGYLTLLANILGIADERLTKIINGINFFVDILGSHDFFLLTLSMIFANAISDEISNGQFFLWIVLPALTVAIAINDDVRYYLYKLCGWYEAHSEKRNSLAKTLDFISGFIKGSMFGIPLISSIESWADQHMQKNPESISYADTSWLCSLDGLIARYVIGVGVMGTLHAALALQYSPYATQDMTHYHHVQLVDNTETVLSTILFLAYFIPALNTNKKADWDVMIGLMCGMYFLSSLFYIWHMKKNVQEPARQREINSHNSFSNPSISPVVINEESQLIRSEEEQDNNLMIPQMTNVQTTTQQDGIQTNIPNDLASQSHLLSLSLFNKENISSIKKHLNIGLPKISSSKLVRTFNYS